MESSLKTEPSSAAAAARKVEFASDVLQQIRQHARSSMRAEICGVLIGSAADGVTRVVARILGEGASQGGAHVTFTQDTWEHIFKIKDKEYPSLSIVGWYHSHPGFGIFLSDYDLFIHENFFNAEHQVAWVFDPHSDEEGCFGWIGPKVEPLSEVTVLRKHRPPAPEQAEQEASSHRAGAVAPPAKARQEAPESSAARSLNGVLVAVLFLLLVGLVVVWFFPDLLPARPRRAAGAPAASRAVSAPKAGRAPAAGREVISPLPQAAPAETKPSDSPEPSSGAPPAKNEERPPVAPLP